MSTYIIGDLQGCYLELMKLLERINYNSTQDRLGFVGDLVNRGPKSLSVLRFIKNLANPLVVLGNHDLYLLAIGYGVVNYQGHHTLGPILEAPDKLELLEWLRQQPFVVDLKDFNSLVVHAGVPPQWSFNEIMTYAALASQRLQGPQFLEFLRDIEIHREDTMVWSEDFTEKEKLIYIVNVFTMMRFCTKDGQLDLVNKTAKSRNPERFKPWYHWYQLPQKVLFGHWAALEGQNIGSQCIPLDTGCVWGRKLTAYKLEENMTISVSGVGDHTESN